MTSRIVSTRSPGLRHRQALGRLMLVLAVATLFLDFTRYCLGTFKPTFDSHRGLSYLKLGKWVKQWQGRSRSSNVFNR